MPINKIVTVPKKTACALCKPAVIPKKRKDKKQEITETKSNASDKNIPALFKPFKSNDGN